MATILKNWEEWLVILSIGTIIWMAVAASVIRFCLSIGGISSQMGWVILAIVFGIICYLVKKGNDWLKEKYPDIYEETKE